MEKTVEQFDKVSNLCREVYSQKLDDYGAAWRILRTSSLTDQIFIKANRIRSIETKGKQEIEEGVKTEFAGIINYSIIALIQLEKGFTNCVDISKEQALEAYNNFMLNAKNLMLKKNHDYDEAWRMMRVSSFTDLILMKLLRIKQIEDNSGITKISEGIDANYYDIINYAIFALIKTEILK